MTERRYDPITAEWRIFAAHRQDRTFLPAAEHCPLCPTYDPARPTEVPADGYQIVVFDNRFPALSAHPPEPGVPADPLYDVRPAQGAAEVIVYTDDHKGSLGGLSVAHLGRLVDVWADRYAVLGCRPDIGYVFVFENRGQAIGVTLDHPHGQVYGYPDIPPLPARELAAARAHQERAGTCVYCDVVAHERADGVRIVAQNRSFLAYVPFAARMPYELHVAAHRHAASLLDLTDLERADLADLLHRVARGYDALFDLPLPYVMAIHQAPTDGDVRWLDVSHLHIEFTPFNRTATKLKYLAGSELGAGAFVADMTPEHMAAALRRASGVAAVPRGDPADGGGSGPYPAGEEG